MAGPVLLTVRVTTTTGVLEAMTAPAHVVLLNRVRARAVHRLRARPNLWVPTCASLRGTQTAPEVVEDGAKQTTRNPFSVLANRLFHIKGASDEEACRVTCRGLIRCDRRRETPHNLFNLISELGKLPVSFLVPRSLFKHEAPPARKGGHARATTQFRRDLPPPVLSSAASTRARAQCWSSYLSVQIARSCLEVLVSLVVTAEAGATRGTRRHPVTGGPTTGEADAACPLA